MRGGASHRPLRGSTAAPTAAQRPVARSCQLRRGAEGADHVRLCELLLYPTGRTVPAARRRSPKVVGAGRRLREPLSAQPFSGERSRRSAPHAATSAVCAIETCSALLDSAHSPSVRSGQARIVRSRDHGRAETVKESSAGRRIFAPCAFDHLSRGHTRHAHGIIH